MFSSFGWGHKSKDNSNPLEVLSKLKPKLAKPTNYLKILTWNI